MRILALDTAGRGGSVALGIGDEIVTRTETAPKRHAASLLPMAEACLAEAGLALRDLDAIAFGRGPGSFTGLRIATGVAQGLAFAAALPVLPVSNLLAAAAAAWRLHGWRDLLVAFDARMGEVYAAACHVAGDGLPELRDEERLIRPEALALPGPGAWHGAGSAFGAWPDLATGLALKSADPDLEPLASDLLGLAAAAFARGEAVAAEHALPVYLREQVAWQGGGPRA